MIIVLASVTVQAEFLAAALQASLVHVRRSLQEPGCLAHGVTQDPEMPNRLQFVERWADKSALLAHFAVAESVDFVRALQRMAVAKPDISIYTADLLSLSTQIQG